MNQNDLRVIKTRKNIEASLIRLLDEKDFHSITVQDLLDMALINRSTFYKHYSDKYALAEEMCRNVFAIFTKEVEQRFQCTSSEDAFAVVKQLYFQLSKRRVEILALFQIHTESIHLYDDMFEYLKARFQKEKGADADYLATLYASLVMTMIKWCLEHNGYEELRRHIADFQVLQQLFQL